MVTHARTRTVVAAWALALGMTGTRAEAQTVTGVVSEPDGSAVAAALVSLRTSDGDLVARAQTAGDGVFLLTLPEGGAYRIRAEAAGHRATESPLFELHATRSYSFDLELTPVAAAFRAPQEVGLVRYEEWVRTHVTAWQTREITIVAGRAWRQAAAGGDLLTALERVELPGVRWERQPNRLCGRTGASTRCLSMVPMSHGAVPRTIDVTPDQVDGVVLVGASIRSAPTAGAMAWEEQVEHGAVYLFMGGYLLIEPLPRRAPGTAGSRTTPRCRRRARVARRAG